MKRSVKNNSQLHEEIIKIDINKPSVQSKVGDYFRYEWTFCGFITTLFPIISWIRSYNLKEWLPSDLVSGITVGIVHIPQGMLKKDIKAKQYCFQNFVFWIFILYKKDYFWVF